MDNTNDAKVLGTSSISCPDLVDIQKQYKINDNGK